ncbi:S-DNA-T family DNA segregation ATPase FtsK/SpoIIIE [Arthrobacter pigmenti]|uniref:S-DNA-T family DNA segregation ATPase FtsK/SpoIIIE n=1 Tax=Arthrobacter pigmenti TaxID=271432 RepID=A0A846RQS2_9MICC|nr:FtsK/SpoIIIE domain-containing protein [Arthrobacter pigmenti]NJC22922.1 S-DNA-T family DNA segregation ATPase FtsK/SpoIIIE [Arthrobacter pigmenti]
MDLHATLAAGPGADLPSGEPIEEIVVNTTVLSTGELLRAELAARTGVEHFQVAGEPMESCVPGVPPLTHGAVIVASRRAHNGEPSPASVGNLMFVVRSGPDAGKLVPLARGTYRIGRSAPEITIHDPELSRTHAVLTVTNEAITLADENSANGIWVDGSRVHNALVTTDSVIRLGASQCALTLTDEPPAAVEAVDLTEPSEVPAPAPPERNRLLLVTALLPLVLGVVLAVTTGMWFFLAFSALSAVTGLIPLVSGRRKRAAFSAAVAAAVLTDSERRRCAAWDVAVLALSALQSRLQPLGPAPAGTLHRGRYVRIGIADQPANIAVKPRTAGWEPPVSEAVPLVIPLSAPTERGGEEPLNLTVSGPPEVLRNSAHLLLLQLCVLEAAGSIICFGGSDDLPSSARFLPQVSLVTDRERLDQLLSTGRFSTLLLFGTSAGAIVRLPGIRVYRFCAPSVPATGGGWTVDYLQVEPALVSPSGKVRFEPDLVQAGTFDYLARALGNAAPAASEDASGVPIPDEVALTDLLAWESASVARRWRMPSKGSTLAAIVGSGGDGPLMLDLVTDGPHLLVAGTTGSGKSEFLRTMVLSLCLTHAPADLNLLFIDFKGGSGLGVLADLPHVTGMLTDLSPAAVSRALISLNAEVKRREYLFAACGATDYLEYRSVPGQGPLPRLAIVIDEFRMLSEEVPGSVQELMRIATLGRSLGLHLILATQRPQGAVTSDIRANVTASVALRMQSPMESQDVLESPIASTIPVRLRGRGYARVGGQRPVEFQTATTAGGSSARPPAIRSLAAYLGDDSSPEMVTLPGTDTTSGLDALIASVRTAAVEFVPPAVRVPVCPALPENLPPDSGMSPGTPCLGLLDVPERQEQYRLSWTPHQDSHLAFIGQPAGGLSAALCSAGRQLLQHLPDTHLYVLDGDGSLRSLAHVPQTGAYVTASDAKRAARVLRRVAALVEHRLSSGTEAADASPAIAILVSGWGRWTGSFRSGRFAWAEEALQDIARDGQTAGVTLLIGGERELISSRFFSLLPNRLYFPTGMNPESLLSWPKMPAVDPVVGRAYVQGRIGAADGAVAQLVLTMPEIPVRQPAQAPLIVAALPATVTARELKLPPTSDREDHIPIGVGGDNLATVCLTLRERSVALLVGPAGSGRSHTLELMAQLAPPRLVCLRPDPGEDPVAFWRTTAERGVPDRALLLVDDADNLPRESHQHLAHLVSCGARIVLASMPSLSAVSSIPLTAAVRGNPLGLVLGARSPSDGDVFGIRLDADGGAQPGRAFLIDAHGAHEIQVAQLAADRREPNTLS